MKYILVHRLHQNMPWPNDEDLMHVGMVFRVLPGESVEKISHLRAVKPVLGHRETRSSNQVNLATETALVEDLS